jgi:hypothetical protein
MLRDKIETKINQTTRLAGGILALTLLAILPLAFLYAAVKVARMAWGP